MAFALATRCDRGTVLCLSTEVRMHQPVAKLFVAERQQYCQQADHFGQPCITDDSLLTALQHAPVWLCQCPQ